MTAADLVIGLDCSTTSTKAIAWDRGGAAIAEGHAPLPMAHVPPGAFEQDVQDWWRSACAALRQLAGQIDPARVAALAIANQRETLGFLDEAGEQVRPAIVWLDERRREDVAAVVAAIGADHLLAVTGKPPDPTPALYSMAWLRRCEPRAFARVAHFVDAHGYVAYRLTGARATSVASADPHGVFDLQAKRHDPRILHWLGLSDSQFFRPRAPGTLLGGITDAAAAATGLRAGTTIVCGGGDGQAGALGCAVLEQGRACLNLGTATVSGVFGRDCLNGRHWRTMTSLSGDGYVFEQVLRTGAFLTDWLVQRLFGCDPKSDPGCYDRLEAEAADIPPGSRGLLLVPYWSGVMNPHWSQDARGVMLGMAPEHHRGHVYRALIEGIAMELALGYQALADNGVAVSEIVAIGGGAKSLLWRRIVADATGRAVCASQTIEASALGAGMLAAFGAGWYPSIAAAARAMQGEAREILAPQPPAAARYAALLDIYQGVYPAMQDSFARLAAFRAGEPA